jgi:cytidylate kinase
MIVTIDGPVATGKSTIAKKLAQELGFIFFDTGAMYRAVTYSILQKGIDENNAYEVEEFLKKFNFDIRIKHGEKKYFVDSEEVTEKIRSQQVTAHVSKISALASVREKLTYIQRQYSLGVNAVFEGRDMGSYVFPEADVKIFLIGKPEVRAQRRYQELINKNLQEASHMSLQQMLEDINQRDAYDSSRTISPLCKAKDAYVIDTSDLTVDEVVLEILEYKDSLKNNGHRV